MIFLMCDGMRKKSLSLRKRMHLCRTKNLMKERLDLCRTKLMRFRVTCDAVNRAGGVPEEHLLAMRIEIKTQEARLRKAAKRLSLIHI